MSRKAKAFGDRIASCLAKFAQVETRSNQRGQRLGLETRTPDDPRSSQDPPHRDG